MAPRRGLRGRSRSVRTVPAGSRPPARGISYSTGRNSLRGGSVARSNRASFMSRPTRSPSRVSFGPSLASRGSSAITSSGVGISGSSVTHSHRPSKLTRADKRVGMPMVWSNNVGYRIDGPSGFTANSSDVAVLLDDASLSNIYNQVVAQTGQDAVPGNQSVAYRAPHKYILETVQAHLTFTNSCLAQAEVDLYEFVATRDVTEQMVYNGNINNTATYYTTKTDPANLWALGSYVQSGTVAVPGAGAPSTNFGASPYDSSMLKQYYKCVNKKRIVLSPGATHRHAINIKVNRLIDGTLLNIGGSPQGQGYPPKNWRGLTRYWMVVQRGMPVSGGKDQPVVTTADTHIDYIWDYRYKFTYVTNSALIVNNQDTLISLAAEPLVLNTFGSTIASNDFT